MRRMLLLAALLAAAGAAPAQRAYLPSMGGGDVAMPITSLKQARTGRTLIRLVGAPAA